ncbi:MAG: hypothetical protein JXR94_03100 [Candidatus Hydrogenedentes bacterium]|nr:hypothetical protein [Candidatus Hydrogenedentota bacterium]
MNYARILSLLGLSVFVLAGAPPQVPDSISRTAEPGLHYGPAGELSLPKTILFSAGPDHIAADAEQWARRGVSAFFMDFVARDWASDIWARDGAPWTIGESDEMFQQARQANAVCRRIGSETFLKVAFDHHFEWFNDTAWQHAYHNFRQFAIFARDTGCTGIALDIEYVGEQYDFEWDGYTYDGYSREELAGMIRERMLGVMRILYDEFPDMVFLTFPEQGFSLGAVIHTAWIEEAARRNAPGGVHYCTEYTYRNPNIRYMFGHTWACNEVFHRLLSRRAWKYWREQCSIAAGVWPFGFDHEAVYEPGMPIEEFRQAYAASLMSSRRYNWIYSHNCREQLIGRELDKYSGEPGLEAYLEVIAAREIVVTPRYVELAKELRALRLRDYASDLGVRPCVSFAGPRDVPSVRLGEAALLDAAEAGKHWAAALDYHRGGVLNLREHFGTVCNWMVLGPFENGEAFAGHHAVYAPEESIDLDAEYAGMTGAIRWIEHRQADRRASVDFTKIYQPTEHVCAYALCYVTSPVERQVQIRLGTNDSGKMWLNGQLVFDYPYEGTAFLDREVVPATLPAGTSSILLKICNGQLNWGFVFRIADADGRPVPDLEYALRPAG